MTRAYVKIGIAGTHSTGKSTFLGDLSDRLEAQGLTVSVVANLASDAKGVGMPILKEETEETVLWIMGEGIRREAEATLRSDVILVDRAIFDALGYLEAALALTGRLRDEARLERLRVIARAYAMDYDALIVTILDPAVPLGPERDPDQEFRRLAGEKIRELVESLALKATFIDQANSSDTISDMVKLVRERLA